MKIVLVPTCRVEDTGRPEQATPSPHLPLLFGQGATPQSAARTVSFWSFAMEIAASGDVHTIRRNPSKSQTRWENVPPIDSSRRLGAQECSRRGNRLVLTQSFFCPLTITSITDCANALAMGGGTASETSRI